MPATKDYQKFTMPGLHWVGGVPVELAQAHVVFVHGLGGNAYSTWTSKAKNPDMYWPAWVAADFPNDKIAVWAYGYDAASSDFGGDPMPIFDRAQNLLGILRARGLTQNPLLFVAHSLGGLVCKKMLVQANHERNPLNTKGTLFIATPHHGSNITWWGKVINHFLPWRPSVLIAELAASAPQLRELHTQYLQLEREQRFQTHCAIEKKRTFYGFKVVSEASGHPGDPSWNWQPWDEDHSSVAKPKSHESDLYAWLKEAIKQLIKHKSASLDASVSGPQIVATVIQSAAVRQTSHFIHLPHSLGDKFIGRENELTNLHQALQNAKGQDVALTTHALQGMGGYGKTRLAVEYAHRYHTFYTCVLMLDAQSPSVLESAMANLCDVTALNLSVASTQTEVRVQAVKAWLAQNAGWLLIADNADTVDAAQAVANLAQALPQGRVLVTTRLNKWGDGFAVVKLHKLNPEAARSLLLTFSAQPEPTEPAEQQALFSIIKQLDGYTLALRVAASYIRERGIRFSAYLLDWENSKSRLLNYNMPMIGDYDKNMVASLMLSIDALDADARALLDRLAWIAPAPIPSHLLDTPLKGVSDVRGALAQLTQQGLVDTQTGEQGESITQIHRVLQAVVRAQSATSADLKNDISQSWIDTLYWLKDAFQGDPADVTAWHTLLPLVGHVQTVLSQTRSVEPRSIAGCDWQDALSFLLNQIGLLFKSRAEWAEAEPFFRRSVAIREASYGENHPEVATGLNNLAALLSDTNRLAEAEPLYRRALAIREASYGENHPEVATILNNLAGLLRATNRLTEAEPLYRRALAIDDASYGENHPEVATTLSNLAGLLRATNRLAEAEPLYRRALAIDVASYGENHPEVATDLNNLAALLSATNRLAEAEPLYRRALAIREASYGENHPEVATILSNLAGLLRATNRLAEAEPLSRRHLEIFVQFRVLHGHEHPNLRAAIGNHVGLLEAMQLSETEIKRRLDEILAPLRSRG